MFVPDQPGTAESQKVRALLKDRGDPGLSPPDRWAKLVAFQQPLSKDLWIQIVRASGGPLGITPKWFSRWKADFGRDIESLTDAMSKYDRYAHGVKQNNVDLLATKANAIIDKLYLLSAYQKPALRQQLRELIVSLESSLQLVTKNPPF